MAVAALTLLAWLLLAAEPAWPRAIIAAVTVLIVACPCALGLATPMSLMVGVGRAASRGILIRNGDALQRAQSMTTLVLDKTGTLTEGRPQVVGQQLVAEPSELLPLLAAVEKRSEHPLAQAITAWVQAQGIETAAQVERFEALSGRGVRARVSAREVLVGNRGLLAEEGIDCASLAAQGDAFAGQGCSLVWVAVDGLLQGIWAIADPLRSDSAQAVARLKARGLKLVLLSGDNASTAQAIAARVGIDQVIAEVRPEGEAGENPRPAAAGGDRRHGG